MMIAGLGTTTYAEFIYIFINTTVFEKLKLHNPCNPNGELINDLPGTRNLAEHETVNFATSGILALIH